jgi:hypothetical protein
MLIFCLSTITAAIIFAAIAPRLHASRKQQLSLSEPSFIPNRAGRDYPYEVLSLNYEEAKWSVYAQDKRPLAGEPLLVVGPKCPKCSQLLEESSKSPTKFRWKCVECKFRIGKKESIEKVSERVEELTANRLREESKSHNAYF